MSALQWLKPANNADAAFKRVPDGWLFRGPDWRTYLVDDTQKAQIVAASGTRRMTVVILLAIALIAAPVMAVAYGSDGAAGPTLATGAVTAALAIALIQMQSWRLLKPILAGACLSDRRITCADQLTAQAAIWPGGALAAAAAGFGLFALLNLRAFVLAPGWGGAAGTELASALLYGAIGLACFVMIGIRIGRRP
jgi:hypothetical protein